MLHNLSQMRRTAQEAVSTILSDSEDLDINDYDHDSDFEIETDHNSGESDLSDDDALTTTPNRGAVVGENVQ